MASARQLKLWQAAPVRELETLYKQAKNAYYNTEEPIMTDTDFDQLEDILRERKPDSKLLNQVGAGGSGAKVKLPFPMSSLEKVKADGSTNRWLKTHKGPYLVSDKMDGFSVQIVGTPSGNTMYSRGKDDYGKNLTHLIRAMAKKKKIPRLADKKAIRGELIISKASFKKWSKEFQNERNMLGALVTRKTPHDSYVDADIIIYSQLSPVGTPSKQLAKLKAEGWHVVPNKVVDTLSEASLATLLSNRKVKSQYHIDGIVIVQDKPNKPGGGRPDFARAFKSNEDNETAQTTVLEIEWNVSRLGTVVPKVLIEPVRLNGVTVKRATGWNAKRLLDMGIGKGAVIEIVRSGDVIPHIIKVIKKASKPSKPSFPVEWDSYGTNFIIKKSSGSRLPPNKEADRVQSIKTMVHFFSTLGVDALKLGNVTKLYDSGAKNILSVVRRSAKQFGEMLGSEIMGNKAHASLVKALKSATHERMMDASGVFGRGIGTRRATAILRKISFATLARMSESTMINKITLLEGFSDKIATQFATGFVVYKQFIDKLESLGYAVKEVAKKKVVSHNLDGQSIVFTGFRDKLLEQAIIENGGTVGSGVSSKTTMVLTDDPGGDSSKLVKARQLKIPIMTPEKFKTKYKIG